MKLQMICCVVAATILCGMSIANAQTNPPPIQWARCYGGYGDDQAQSIQQTFDGGYIVAGYSDSSSGDVTGAHNSRGIGNNDYWVIKLDSLGLLQWERSYGGSGDDFPLSVQQTRDSGYIIAGASNSKDGDVTENHGGYDYWIVKLDKKGDLEWQRSLGGDTSDIARCVQQTNDGGYIIAGSSLSNNGDVTGNHGFADYWIVKLDSIGSIEWQRSLGGSQTDQAYSIQQTSDDGYIAAGYSLSYDGDVTKLHDDTLYGNYWIVKLDSIGNIEWQRSLGGSDGDYAYSVHQTYDGGYIVAGLSYSTDVIRHHGAALPDCYIVKLDSTGNIEWADSYGGFENDGAYSIQQTLDSGYIMVGYSGSADHDVTGNHGDEDYWIVKIDSVGNIQWEKSLGGTYGDAAYSVQQTRDSGYVVAGWSDSYDGDVTGDHGTPRQGAPGDFWIVKLHEKVKSCYSDTINFDTVDIGDCKTYTYCFANNGGAPYSFTGVSIIGTNAGEYTLDTATFKVLNPGNEEEIVFKFCPTAAGEQDAMAGLVVGDSDTIFIPIYGIGVQPARVTMPNTSLSPILSAQNYPNPFTAVTQIEYTIPQAGDMNVTIMDAVGNKVAELFNGWQAAGSHTVSFDAKDLPAGAYFVRCTSGGGSTTKSLALFR